MGNRNLIKQLEKLTEFKGFEYDVKTYDKFTLEDKFGVYAIIDKPNGSGTAYLFGQTEKLALEYAIKYSEEQINAMNKAQEFIKNYCSVCTHNSDPHKNYRKCDTLDNCFAQKDSDPTEFNSRCLNEENWIWGLYKNN